MYFIVYEYLATSSVFVENGSATWFSAKKSPQGLGMASSTTFNALCDFVRRVLKLRGVSPAIHFDFFGLILVHSKCLSVLAPQHVAFSCFP